MRGTPLAMLAAQCNKLSSMSPPPLADAAVGKGFHPWKKSGQSVTGDSPDGRRLSAQPDSPASQQQQQHQHQQQQQQPTSTAASSSSTATTAATSTAYSSAPQYGKAQFRATIEE